MFSCREKLVILLSGVALVGCARPTLTAEDGIVSRDSQATLVAYVDQRWTVFNDGLGGVEVTFAAGDSVLGHRRTDQNGAAILSQFKLPQPYPEYFTVEAKLNGKTLSSRAPLFIWEDDRPVVAVDYDETICRTQYLDLLFSDNRRSLPLVGSREALNRLAEDYHILYVSARPRFLLSKSWQWLRQYDYPPGPLLFADNIKACFQQGGSKQQILASVKKRWPQVLIGIGDKYEDVLAYRANNMLTVIVNPWEPRYGNDVIVLYDWPTLVSFFEKNRDKLNQCQTLKKILAMNPSTLDPLGL